MSPNTEGPLDAVLRRRQSSRLPASEEGTSVRSVRFSAHPDDENRTPSLVTIDIAAQPSSVQSAPEEIKTEQNKSPAQQQHSGSSEHDTLPPFFIDTIENVFPDEASNNDDDEAPVTWHDVFTACCCHSCREWRNISIALIALLTLLYLFLIGLELLSRSFRVVGGCTAESLLGSNANPVSSLMVGILATAVLQSSSTTTSIVVSLVSGGLDVHTAIYIVMGANIGTSVTALLVSLAHLGDADELERAFSGSSVVWFFKVLTVIVLFPLEVSVQYLYRLTKPMLPKSVGEGEKWEGPIKKIVSPLTNKIIIANKNMIDDIASSGGTLSCDDYYPVVCQGGVESYDTCQTGLIDCDSKTKKCPVFFQDGSSRKDDSTSGWVALIYALVLLIICLIGLVTLLRMMLLGASQRIIYKATSINGYLAMAIGCGATVLVQSSSIVISTLVPLIGMGVLDLERMYPLTLGADVGTTFTALMAAMVSNSVQSLQVALVHLFFNVNGIIMWYPIPFLRRIPLNLARRLGRGAKSWRGLPLTFILQSFFVVPLIILGIATCFDQDSTGFTALGVFLILAVGLGAVYFIFWWKCRSGKDKCHRCMTARQRRKAAVNNLADDLDYLKVDMEYVKNEIGRLKQIAGLHYEVRPARPSMHGGSVYTQEQEETLSLYESCRSRAWPDILASAARSSAGSIGGWMGGDGSARSTIHTTGSTIHTAPGSTRSMYGSQRSQRHTQTPSS